MSDKPMSDAEREIGSAPHYSDEEVIALHNKVRSLGSELQAVLDELLRRVAVMYEGTDEHAGAVEAIAQIQSLRDDDCGTGSGS